MDYDSHIQYLQRTNSTYPFLLALIGADYNWSIVEDETIRGDGSTAVKSRIGYLLSGPVMTKNGRSSTIHSAKMIILNDHRSVAGNLEMILSLKSLGVTGSNHTKSQSEVVSQYREKYITPAN